MSNNPTNQEKNKEPKQKAQATVKTAVAKHCLTESIAVNIICGLLFLVFVYIVKQNAVNAFDNRKLNIIFFAEFAQCF